MSGPSSVAGPPITDKRQLVEYHEAGNKPRILEGLRSDHEIVYITDTSRDVAICKALGIPAIGATWGYEPMSVLSRAEPEFLVKSPDELIALLAELGLTRN